MRCLALALTIVLSIGAVRLIDNYLGPIDQAEAHYSPAGSDCSSITTSLDATIDDLTLSATAAAVAAGTSIRASGLPAAMRPSARNWEKAAPGVDRTGISRPRSGFQP